MNTYEYGSLVRVSVAFTAVSDGTAYDPTTVTLSVREPDLTETDYTYALGAVTKSGTGAYYKDISATKTGDYKFYWAGGGTGQAAVNGAFKVKQILAQSGPMWPALAFRSMGKHPSHFFYPAR